MSLTLEEVRRVRFRMARRGVTGYDVADVDNFIDKVEESFGQFENERDLLRREAQSAGGQGDAAPAADPQELAAKDSEIANLRAEVERLSHEAGVAAERRRLAAELHDTVTQGLSSIVMLAQASRTAAGGRLDEHLDLIEQTARANLAEARAMVNALVPDEAEAARAETLLAELAETAGASFAVEGEPRGLAPATAVMLMRATQEALRNVDKHAAGARVRVRLVYLEDGVAVSVADDGPGFDPQSPSSGFGLRGVRNRVVGLGGTFAVDSAPGRGATVRLEVPA